MPYAPGVREAMEERRARDREWQRQEDEAGAFLDSISGGEILAPEHEWILGGTEAVRQIPGADYLLGGVLDALEDVGWYGETSPLGAGLAALDVVDPTPLSAALLPVKREIKDKLGERGLRMAFEDDAVDFGDPATAFELEVLEGDTVLGGVTGDINPDNQTMSIALSEIDEELRGKGVGGAMYDAIRDEAERRGYDLTSDMMVSPDAQRMYDRFARQGYDVELNPKASGTPGEDQLLSWGEPVYRVRTGEPLPLMEVEEIDTPSIEDLLGGVGTIPLADPAYRTARDTAKAAGASASDIADIEEEWMLGTGTMEEAIAKLQGMGRYQ